MKILILSLALLLSAATKAQTFPLDSTTQKVDYQTVVHVDSVSKDELFTRAREWFALAFKDSKEVIQMDDRANGKLIGKGTTKGYFKVLLMDYPFRTRFTLSVICKDSRYRYEMTDFVIINDASDLLQTFTAEEIISKKKDRDGKYSGRWKSFLGGVDDAQNLIIQSLKEAMNKKGAKSKDDF